jgi:foldase protein PrsA
LRQLLAHRLNANNLDSASLKAIKTQAKNELAQVKQYMNEDGTDEFKAQLTTFNLQESDVLDFIEKSLILRKVFDKKVSTQEAQKQYNQIIAEDISAYQTASVRHILIAIDENRTEAQALARAKEVRTKLANGGSFITLAKQYSDDPGSSNNGGLYADTDVSIWVEEFKNAAVNLPLNALSQPIKSNFGYHIMRVEKRTRIPFEQVKQEIMNGIASINLSDYMEKEIPKLIISKNLKAR